MSLCMRLYCVEINQQNVQFPAVVQTDSESLSLLLLHLAGGSLCAPNIYIIIDNNN